jgi:fructokinase
MEAIEALKDLPKVLHVGSLSMTNSPSREATIEAIKYAKENRVLISYDPNFREALWESKEQAVEMMEKIMPYADILKVSDEEMLMLTGTDDNEKGSRILAEKGVDLVMVTLGADGVFVRRGELAKHIPGFNVVVADTNGAGDTFFGAMLMQLTEHMNNDGTIEDLSEEELCSYLFYANRAASVTCSRKGAIPAMPTAEEMAVFRANR